jgi:hypothetical protein
MVAVVEIPIHKDILLQMKLKLPQLALQDEDKLLSRNTRIVHGFLS